MRRLSLHGLAFLTCVAIITGCSKIPNFESSKSESKQREVRKVTEHAVIAYLKISGDSFGGKDEHDRIFQLENKLTAAINTAKAGEFDGNEFGGGVCKLYMYGPDADKLAAAVLPVLKQAHLQVGSYVVKRYGEANNPSSREEKVQL